MTYGYTRHPADCPGCGTYSGDEDLCPIQPARDVRADRLRDHGHSADETTELRKDPT